MLESQKSNLKAQNKIILQIVLAKLIQFNLITVVLC